jgi:hypothetical protein
MTYYNDKEYDKQIHRKGDIKIIGIFFRIFLVCFIIFFGFLFLAVKSDNQISKRDLSHYRQKILQYEQAYGD